jgi:hypothetical protein
MDLPRSLDVGLVVPSVTSHPGTGRRICTLTLANLTFNKIGGHVDPEYEDMDALQRHGVCVESYITSAQIVD